MAKKVERSLDRDGIGLDLEQLVDRFELLVDLARRLGVTLSESANHRLDAWPDDVRVDANTADSAELEVGLGDDAPRLGEVVIRLLDRPNGRDCGELDDRLGLEVDHDAGGDVVDVDRPVADGGDGAEVLDDPARGRP